MAGVVTALDPFNYQDTMKEVCGGFFVDNYVADSEANDFFDLYFATQVRIGKPKLFVVSSFPWCGSGRDCNVYYR